MRSDPPAVQGRGLVCSAFLTRVKEVSSLIQTLQSAVRTRKTSLTGFERKPMKAGRVVWFGNLQINLFTQQSKVDQPTLV